MGRTLTAVGAGVALALVAALGVAPGAWAHDQLVDADPAAGETVATASQVALTFSGALLGPDDETANLAQVTDAAGRHYETSCAVVDGAALTVPVALGGAGEYTVSWRVVSSDGHPVSGEYAFDYAPAEGTDAATGTDASACAAVAAGSASTAKGADAETAGLVIGLSVGAVVIVVLAIIVVVTLRGRRTPGEAA